MKFNLSIEYDKSRFLARVQKLLDKEAKVELKECFPARSLNQNNYFHACAGLVAQHTGYTIEEVKDMAKDDFGSFMIYEKAGHVHRRSTADLDTKLFSQFTEWFLQWAFDVHEVYCPNAEDYIKYRFEIEKQLENVK